MGETSKDMDEMSEQGLTLLVEDLAFNRLWRRISERWHMAVEMEEIHAYNKVNFFKVFPSTIIKLIVS